MTSETSPAGVECDPQSIEAQVWISSASATRRSSRHFTSTAKGTRTPDPHTASVKTRVLQRATASTVYRIMPACNPSSY